jgi:hypothetical protein
MLILKLINKFLILLSILFARRFYYFPGNVYLFLYYLLQFFPVGNNNFNCGYIFVRRRRIIFDYFIFSKVISTIILSCAEFFIINRINLTIYYNRKIYSIKGSIDRKIFVIKDKKRSRLRKLQNQEESLRDYFILLTYSRSEYTIVSR